VGKRFVPDLATKNSPSYSVEVVGQEYSGRTFVVTLYSVKLPQPIREWWHVKKTQKVADPEVEKQLDSLLLSRWMQQFLWKSALNC
jgi:hypothetical protein